MQDDILNKLNNAIIKAINEVYRKKHYFGGNSGYVGYSKSRRACDAEDRGLRSISNMDNEFKEEVNSLLAQENHKSVTLAYIKKIAKTINADEWHHTSMYGNKTNYYSPENIAQEIITLERNNGLSSKEIESIKNILYDYSRRLGDSIYIYIDDYSIRFNNYPLDKSRWTIQHNGRNKYGERIVTEEIPLSEASDEEKRMADKVL